MTVYRFQKCKTESNTLLKGENGWYRILDDQDVPLWAVHVTGSCLGGTTTFHREESDPRIAFRLEPKRKMLNLTYYLKAGETGPEFATIHLKASRGMRVTGQTGEVLFSIVDPRKPFDTFMNDILGGCCTEYAVIAGRELVGIVERRTRPGGDAIETSGLLNRFRRKVFRAMARDWCIDLDDGGSLGADHRPLLAAMILLQEQTIRMDQAS